MTSDKLKLLIDTKNKIRMALIEAGIDLSLDTPFSEYPNYIKSISAIEETTDIADLMELADFYQNFNKGKYENYSYNEKEQLELTNLINLIINGEEI